jgi:hypothetical protein
MCDALAAFKALTESATLLGYTQTAPTVIPVVKINYDLCINAPDFT